MSLSGNKVIGIRREDKNKWERRVPLTPDQVKSLVDSGITVLVQPSGRRIFPNGAYEEAGATVQEDLTPASVILAVKEVPQELLLPGRTYVFFTHTIKAQDYNMPLLDTLLAKNIRCIDYECITEGGVWKGKRLVAFGRYAGIAGMVDFFRGMGARALALGYSTPLLNIGSSYMYRDVEAAMAAVSGAGASIAKYGLPAELSPLVLTFTGRGNVSKGAQEIAQLLPHRMVAPEEVPGIISNASGKDRTHTVYIVQATAQHMVRKKGKAGAPSAALESYPVDAATGGFKGLPSPADFFDADFDRAHYKANPEQYEGVFHVAVAPYSSAIINCMYWDGAYPRLINLKQSRALGAGWRCLGICDISCDEQGSIELLRKFTSIDEPFYVYDTATDAIHEGEAGMSADGVLFHAVDHLPSELPADASAHFGNALLPLLPQLASSDGSLPWEQQTDLPEALRGAVITAHGQLTPRYKYIASLRAANERAKSVRGMKRSKRESFMSLRLVGHLFDTGIINAVLDVLEESGCSANIVDVDVGRDRSEGTSMALQVFSQAPETLSDALGAVATLVTGTDGVQVLQGDGDELVGGTPPAAAGVGAAAPESPPKSPSPKGASQHSAGNVLLLGAGFVSGPLADYLLRVPGTRVTVASMFEQEAINFAAARPRCHPVTLNVAAEGEKLNQLVSQHDLVVSLVPAPFHPVVARAAIANRKNMVTASYVSPELAELQAEAAAAGVVILNEVGLDPGIDHISAVALLDSVQAAGQKILSFSSNCGGLPAPEAAANRLGYKFSWSPRGVLTASRNASVWLSGGADVSVPGEHLMAAAAPYALFKNPAFDLEVLPNRDCRKYAAKYGIPDVPHIFRGTLRYGGFPKLMFAFATLGFLDLTPNPALTREADGQNAPDYTTGPPLKGVLAECAGADPAKVLTGEVDDTALVAAIEAKVSAAWNEAATSVQTARSASDALVAAEVNAKQAAGETVQQASLWSEKDTAALEAVLRDLDFFEATKPAPRTPSGTALDTFTALLSAAPQLSYAENERDAALMQHEVLAAAEDGTVTRHVSTLVQYGNLDTGVSCMSLTVGVTAAIGVQLILDGKGGSAQPGVHTPVTKEWWQPMLAALAAEGIALTESSETLPPALASAVVKYLGGK